VRVLGATACLTFLGFVLMAVFVTARAAPLFSHQGLSWLGSGGDVDTQIGAMANGATDVHVHVWTLIYGSLLTTALAVVLALGISLLTAIFIVDLAPRRVRGLMLPVIRLLASVPSVIYGLIGILVLVPFVGNDLITTGQKESVINVIQLTGAGLLVSVVILTVMITPIITALTIEALAGVPRSWHEGAVALGLNPVRATIAVSLRAVRPAIVAATALAAARALGEAIVLEMVSGGKAFSPNPADGLIFIYEPLKTMASTIIDHSEDLSTPDVRATIYALALVLMVSGLALSIASRVIRRSLRKYELSS
jgi:ABC-type phosphate transport system permease subunit